MGGSTIGADFIDSEGASCTLIVTVSQSVNLNKENISPDWLPVFIPFLVTYYEQRPRFTSGKSGVALAVFL